MCVCVWGGFCYLSVICAIYVKTSVYSSIMHVMYSMLDSMWAHEQMSVDKCFHQLLIHHLARGLLLFFFLFRLLTPPVKLLLHFYPGPHKGSTTGERIQMEERKRPGGPRCALCAREERKKRPPPPKCLYLCLNDWCVSQNSSGSALVGPNALLTQIHPGPYHLEDIMGNAWQSCLTPPKGSPVASPVKYSSNQLI